jgi:neutral ceramidase
MSGYVHRTKPAEGKLTELWAKALALEDPAGRRAVLVTLDLVGIDRQLSQTICQAVQRRYQLPREALVLAVSHTHSGPVVGDNLAPMFFLDERQQQLVRAYASQLQEHIQEVVGQALAQLAAAELSWQTGKATFAVNRRNNKETEVPRLRELGKLRGPVDHEVPVLAVRDPQGHLKAVVFGYACHATVLAGYEWCGDYPTYAQMALEQAHPGIVALFWAGCGGDQNPLPRRSVALAKHYGQELAEAVEAVLRAPLFPLAGKLEENYREIPLPFAALPSREQLVRDSLSPNRSVARRARLLLDKLQREKELPSTYPYPIQVWRLGGELLWVFLGGEVVVDYALRLKRELVPGRTWITAYANDVMAYIPSLRVWKEGGYEGGGAMLYYGLPSVWSPRVEEILVAAVREQVQRLGGGRSAKTPAPPARPYPE